MKLQLKLLAILCAVFSTDIASSLAQQTQLDGTVLPIPHPTMKAITETDARKVPT